MFLYRSNYIHYFEYFLGASPVCPLQTPALRDPSEIGIISYYIHLWVKWTDFMELLKNFSIYSGT
jgi:hypothetical protein